MLTKHAKVIAMTCTHAAIKRRDLIALNFQYDNLIMEEAAQIMEIETFIPMVLQNPDPTTGRSRLKRVVLIGDHQQLPPVVKNLAFQKYSKLDQSLFARFVRLGVPAVQLDKQGRARKAIADLYRWRYNALGDLPTVSSDPRFALAVPGFVHSFQLIDVGDLQVSYVGVVHTIGYGAGGSRGRGGAIISMSDSCDCDQVVGGRVPCRCVPCFLWNGHEAVRLDSLCAGRRRVVTVAVLHPEPRRG